MALAGGAFLALWNDIAHAREAEYDQWHTLEHVPERVAVHGFYGARRYVNRSRDQHRYFTLYDVETLAVFESAEYRDLLERPTPRSAAMRPDFSNVLRATCTVVRSQGTGIGAAVATLCVPAEVTESRIASVLEGAHASPAVTGTHLGERREVGSGVRLPASTSTAPVREFVRIALIEALDVESARRALAHAQSDLALDALAPDFGTDVYALAFVFPGADPRERLAHRRPAWGAEG